MQRPRSNRGRALASSISRSRTSCCEGTWGSFKAGSLLSQMYVYRIPLSLSLHVLGIQIIRALNSIPIEGWAGGRGRAPKTMIGRYIVQ